MAQLYGRAWTRSELLERVGRVEQLAAVEPLIGDDGRERANRVLQVRTGSGLAFQVEAERALDVSSCHFRGIPVGWSSPVGEVHPAYYEPGGLGWLRSFPGGLFVTCGLDQFGAPSRDGGEELGLHGRVSNLPARSVGHRGHWEQDEYHLEVSGEVRQAQVFGENLVLQRRIVTRLGWDRVEIEDTVTNEGFDTHPHMILYHFNLGFPLISPLARMHLETEQTVARDEDAQAGLGRWQEFDEPTADYREQVFRHVPSADREGKARIEVENASVGLAWRLSYSREELPHLFQWKMMGRGTYVLGIEPANSSGIEGRATARERDDLPHLEPGESRSYHLRIEFAGTDGEGGRWSSS